MTSMCEIEMTFEETSLLRSLLKIETVYQVRVNVMKEQSDENKVVKIISVFDTYAWLDKQLVAIQAEIKKNNSKADESLINLVMVDRKVAKLYQLLVVETHKMVNIPQVKEDFARLGGLLTEKIIEALKRNEEGRPDFNSSLINMGGVGIA